MKYLDLTGLQYFYKKYIKTLGSAAKQTVANNLTTTAAGSVLDARQGKTLSDKITSETKTLNSERSILLWEIFRLLQLKQSIYQNQILGRIK